MNFLHDRLKSERVRLELNQEEFAEKGGVKRRAQAHYESGERCPDGHYFSAIAAIGADVQYILTSQRSLNPRIDPIKADQKKHRLYLVTSATETIGALKRELKQSLALDAEQALKPEDDYLFADLHNILYFVAQGKAQGVIDAMKDYAGSNLTPPEKALLTAYRQAAQPDKAFMERLAYFAAKAALDEAAPSEE